MAKQWSLFVRYTAPVSGEVVSQFLWVAGQGGVQIDRRLHTGIEIGRYPVTFPGTDSFDGFVRWTMDCVHAVQGMMVLQPGCPDCGGVLNAQASNCDGLWHAANREAGLVHLEQFMADNFPKAVAQANGDAALAAMNLVSMSRDAIRAVWPMIVAQIQVVANALRSAGVDIPNNP